MSDFFPLNRPKPWNQEFLAGACFWGAENESADRVLPALAMLVAIVGMGRDALLVDLLFGICGRR